MAPHFKNPTSYLMSHLALYLKDQFTIITSEFGKRIPCYIKKEEKKTTKNSKEKTPSSAGVWLSVSLHVTQIILAWCVANAPVGGLVSLVQQRELKAPSRHRRDTRTEVSQVAVPGIIMQF